MPKASMHEDDFLRTDEDKIRASREVATVKPIPIAKLVHETPDGHLRPGVLRPHRTHDVGPVHLFIRRIAFNRRGKSQQVAMVFLKPLEMCPNGVRDFG